MLLFLLLALLGRSAVEGVEIDNGVVGLPQVNCEEEKVSLIFNTERSFGGRIFVKGMSDTDGCVTDYAANQGSSIVFQMGSGGCNMRRQRRLGPQRGVEQSMTVIISFHETFITKIDRAYRCTCFFMEADKVVTQQFDVSMLPTTDLIDTARMPLCTYSVHRGAVDGPVVTYARVGEEAYHVWECDSDMFGMLVHSCFVDDGQGQQRFQLLDQSGCAIDPVILTDLQYNDAGNQAFVEAHVFKFADRVSTYFQCAISLCMRSDGACEGMTPPRCQGGGAEAPPARFRREIAQRNGSGETRTAGRRSAEVAGEGGGGGGRSEADVDVSAERIVVLDIDDRVEAEEERRRDLGAETRLVDTTGDGPFAYAGSYPRLPAHQICLSPYGFGVLLAIFLLIFSSALATVCVHCWRQRSLPTLKA